MNNQEKDDKSKMNMLNRFRRLQTRMLVAASLMFSGIGLRHPSEEEREFIKREPIFKESAYYGSGFPPDLVEDLKDKYQLLTNDNTPIYSLNSAHAEKTKDGYRIVLFDADGKEINCK